MEKTKDRNNFFQVKANIPRKWIQGLFGALTFFAIAGLFPVSGSAIDAHQKKTQPEPKTEAQKMKMTIPEAKEICKNEGKTGDDLIKCIEEKQKN